MKDVNPNVLDLNHIKMGNIRVLVKEVVRKPVLEDDIDRKDVVHEDSSSLIKKRKSIPKHG